MHPFRPKTNGIYSIKASIIAFNRLDALSFYSYYLLDYLVMVGCVAVCLMSDIVTEDVASKG